jgi:D-psicose/D-tagatose/L-ribulose 3-epimerase
MNNKIGVHMLVFTAGFSEKDLDYAIGTAKEIGYDYIELPLLNPYAIDVDLAKKALQSHNMQAVCLLGLSFDTDISSDDPDVRQNGQKLLWKALEVSAGLGAWYLGGVIYSAMAKYLKPATEENRKYSAEFLAQLAEKAKSHGIKIGIEPVNRYESNLVNTGRQAIEFIKLSGSDNIFVHLDSYHMNIEENDQSTPVHECQDYLGYVHINENHRGYLGSGSLDFTSLFHALADIKYTGPIAFESFSSAVISEDFRSSLAIWRDLWTDSKDLASRAKTFIDNYLYAAYRNKQ